MAHHTIWVRDLVKRYGKVTAVALVGVVGRLYENLDTVDAGLLR